MKTSYFAKYKKEDGISIALSCPNWFKGPSYRQLNPTWNMLEQYRLTRDQESYIKVYNQEILSKLDPQQVYDDLKDKVLLCWEKKEPGMFCHRRLVADWIYKHLDIYVPEI